MIIEIAIGAGALALGGLVLKALRKRRAESSRAVPSSSVEPAEPPPQGSPSAATAAPPSQRPDLPRGLRIGDVLLYATEELWLAGEVYLDEEGFVASLFPVPGCSLAQWVAQLDPEAKRLALLQRTAEVPGGPVPTELPIGGFRVSLAKRGQARVAVAGEHLPETTERARYAIFEGPGGKLLVVVDFDDGARLALTGECVGRDLVDLLPGGDVAAG